MAVTPAPGEGRARGAAARRAAANAVLLPPVDPERAAGSAGLRHATDGQPGITRRRTGTGFSYRGPGGQTIRDPEELSRIRSLAVPPAWTDVWISADPRSHIQATGRDARGRKQYRYHPRWRVIRDETKFGRMIAFAEALPHIRDRVDADLRRPGLPRERVLAAVTRLLEETLIRVGNDEYARANRSFGLTTLRDRHVTIDGSEIRFRFRAKAGKLSTVGLTDRRLARVVRRCQELPGQELFQYEDESGELRRISSEDVNAYLREASGADFTAKDFRTWAGTLLAYRTLRGMPAATSAAEARRRVVEAIRDVAGRLGNTEAVCRRSYVHPAVVDAYVDGSIGLALAEGGGAGPGSALDHAPRRRGAASVASRQDDDPRAEAAAPVADDDEEREVAAFLRRRLAEAVATPVSAGSKAAGSATRARRR